jgi:N-methylhydantoinase A
MKFGRQVNVETIPVPKKPYTEQDVNEICNSFIGYYHSLYGEGAAFVEAGLEIMTFIVHAVKPAILPAMPKLEFKGEDSSHAFKGKREVFLPDSEKFAPVNTYEFGMLMPGNVISGPAIIEAPTTTMFILSGQLGKVDEYRNLKVTERG